MTESRGRRAGRPGRLWPTQSRARVFRPSSGLDSGQYVPPTGRLTVHRPVSTARRTSAQLSSAGPEAAPRRIRITSPARSVLAVTAATA